MMNIENKIDQLKNDTLFELMNKNFEKGRLKDAAICGAHLLKSHHLTALIDRQVYRMAFGELEEEFFYKNVVESIIWYCKENEIK